MELPSTREIDLEILVRERDKQLVILTDEVRRLRAHVSSLKDHVPSNSDPFPFPASTMARLSPYINSTIGGPNSAGAAHINAEFLQRYKILELENEELYQHLKSTTTGRLMEENKALNSVVDKLTSALKDAQKSLVERSAEADLHWQNYFDRIESNKLKQQARDNRVESHSRGSPRLSSGGLPGHNSDVPTSPRANKKARLSRPEELANTAHHDGFGGTAPPKGPRNAGLHNKSLGSSWPRHSPSDGPAVRHNSRQPDSSFLSPIPDGPRNSNRASSPRESARGRSPDHRRQPSGSEGRYSMQDDGHYSPPSRKHAESFFDPETSRRSSKHSGSSRRRSRDSVNHPRDNGSGRESSRLSESRHRIRRDSPSRSHQSQRSKRDTLDSRGLSEEISRSSRGENPYHRDANYKNERRSNGHDRPIDDTKHDQGGSHKRGRHDESNDVASKRFKDEEPSELEREHSHHRDSEPRDGDETNAKGQSNNEIRVKGAHREQVQRESQSRGQTKKESREQREDWQSGKSLLDRIH